MDRQTRLRAAFKAVTAGESHACGLRTDNTITCWGWNITWTGRRACEGELQSRHRRRIEHACGLRTDNTITCWGWNQHGQADASTGSFTAVTAGGNRTCGLRTDGVVECWGSLSTRTADPVG